MSTKAEQPSSEERDRLQLTTTDVKGLKRTGPQKKVPSMKGKELAHFRLERKLGSGAMGEVYLATDLALDRPVAVKVLSREVADNEKTRRRFYREARSQARLQHPNVCHIYYIGEQDDQIFFAMEYIEGESLQTRLERDGAIPANEAIEIIRQAALGLREAHRHGFSHRDIKPSNIMIDERGAVKVVDFGLVQQEEGHGGKTLGHRSTIGSARIVGTPLYMPPEQARGDEVDFRADIYALGGTMHHMIAGKAPYEGRTPMEVVSKHVAKPRPRLVRASKLRGPAMIDQLLDRMMAKEPADRFDSYDDLIDALEHLSPAHTRMAGFGIRALAVAIDLAFIRLLALPFEWSVLDDVALVLPVLALVYSVLAVGRWGSTVGKAVLEIEVISATGHGPPSYFEATARYLVQWGLLHLAVGAALVVQTTTGGNQVGDAISGSLIGAALFITVAEGAVAVLRTADRRTLWDRVANSQVRFRRHTSDHRTPVVR